MVTACEGAAAMKIVITRERDDYIVAKADRTRSSANFGNITPPAQIATVLSSESAPCSNDSVIVAVLKS